MGGYDFLVLRFKVVFGGVLRKRRPPHPLHDKKERAKVERPHRRGRPGRRSSNPNSNLARLKKAYEDEDVTKGLLYDPRENEGWLARFGQPPSNETESETEDMRLLTNTSDDDNIRPPQQPTAERIISKRALKYSRYQLTLFSSG